MRIGVVSLFPSMLREAMAHGVLGRAVERGVVTVDYFDPREHTTDVHRTVDDRPYGGGPGMVLKVEPLRDALRAARAVLPAGSRSVWVWRERLTLPAMGRQARTTFSCSRPRWHNDASGCWISSCPAATRR